MVRIKRAIPAALAVALVAASLPSQVRGRAQYDRTARVAGKTDRLQQYTFPQRRSELTAREYPQDISSEQAAAARQAAPVSLGSAEYHGVSSPGFTLYNTWMDDQYRPPAGRAVDFRTTPDIHFVYSAASGPTANSGFGYNVYDPVNGQWADSAGVGCRVQPPDQNGRWVMMDVDPSGLVIMGGEDDADGSYENHFYRQTSPYSCAFGSGSQIPLSQYNDGHFLNPTESHLSHPKVEVQEVGADTIVHVLAGESCPVWDLHPDLYWGVTSYYRLVGMDLAGTWEGPVVIDTIAWAYSGSMSASRVSPKVAVSYTKYHEMALLHNQPYDCEVYIRRSSDAGENWAPPVNITTYSREEASWAAWLETNVLYDSEDNLHVIWNASPVVADAYNDPSFFFGDFSACLFHWSDRIPGPRAGGTISTIHDANWGIEYNMQVCGFGSPETMYIGYFTLSECDGRLYTFFTQYLDVYGLWDSGAQIDDCTSGGFTNREYAANGELAMSVSVSLDGLLWDPARNLTNTYTPDCDSAEGGGVCMNDTRPTVSRYGMDVTAYGGTLVWPGPELVDPSIAGELPGNKYMHLSYLEDHFPGPGWRNPDLYGRLTENAVKWMRIPCVGEVLAPTISVWPWHLGYPEFVLHGEADTVTITVTNEGNTTLSVSEIGVYAEPAGSSGWLGVSTNTLEVPGGLVNSNTFDIYINVDGIIDQPGTIVSLSGEVYLLSNAYNADSVSIRIENFIVGPETLQLSFDTISTAAATRVAEPGEYISLIVSNIGEMGFNGNSDDGTLNMDYMNNGGECNPAASVYLYSGGPLLIKADVDGTDTTFLLSQAMWQDEFFTDISFKRIFDGASEASVSDPEYDGFFTGTLVNRDTTIAMERAYYAPTTGGDSADFIIVETRYFSYDGQPHGPLTIGEAADWDIPSGTGSSNMNLSGILPRWSAVYVQGVDTTTEPLCQPNSNRFGAVAMLGYSLASRMNANPCYGECLPYGAFAGRNDSLWLISDSLRAGYFWYKMRENIGINAEPSGEPTDLHSIMTYVQDYTLPANDTLSAYAVYTTVHDGGTSELFDNLNAAFEWYTIHLRTGCLLPCECCIGLTGNVDGDLDDQVDVGDLTELITYLYIPPNQEPACFEEANIDGDSDGVVDIADLTALVSYLYVPPSPEPAPCRHRQWKVNPN
jgi:hypothetical protein